MRISILFLLTSWSIISCNDESKSKLPVQNTVSDSSIHLKKDDAGRIVEKWGNYHRNAADSNFRFFFQYDSSGLLTNEKRYFLDPANTDCVIKDSALYDEITYYYKYERNKYILEETDSYTPAFDSAGKYIGRKLYYKHGRLKGRDIQVN